MSELRAVYTPVPAYSPQPHPSPSSVKPAVGDAAKVRVVVTVKRRTNRKEREESKQQQQQPVHSKSSSAVILTAARGSSSQAEEEKERVDEEEDEDEEEELVGASEEQQRLRLEEDIARSWVEFIDPKSSTRVYINVRTGEMAWQRPAAMEEEDEEEERTRRRSRAKAAGDEEEAGSVMADELSDLFSLGSIPPARLLSSMRHIDRAVQHMLAKAVNLSPALLTSLSSIHSQLQSSVQSLSSLVQSSASSPVEALISYDSLPWSFASSAAASSAIDHYRAAAALQHAEETASPSSHSGLSAAETQYPVYLSSIALPAHLRQYTVSVRLPSDDDAAVPRLLNVTITASDTATSVIKHALYKGLQRLTGERQQAAGGSSQAVDDFVLKAVGSEEYMMGERALFEYEYVRQQMRQGEDAHLVVVRRRPQLQPADPAGQQLAVEYQQKLNPAVVPLNRASFAHLSLRSPLPGMQAFSAYDVHLPFRYKVLGVDHLSPLTLPLLTVSPAASAAAGSAPAASTSAAAAAAAAFTTLTVRSFLFHGTVRLPETSWSTPESAFASSLRFNSWASCPTVCIDSMPRAVRIAFTLVGRREDGRETLLAWVVKQLVDEGGEMLSGRRELKLWPARDAGKKSKHAKPGRQADDADAASEQQHALFRATTRENESDRASVRLTVLFAPFALPVVFPLQPPPAAASRPASKTVSAPAVLSKQQQKHLDELLARDHLYPFTAADLQLLYSQRLQAMRIPHALPVFLLSVNWLLPEQRQEAHRLLKEWTPFYSPLSALILLDVRFADSAVREHAVHILRRLSDSEFSLYLLQLVQCVKYEACHHSALAFLLVSRAVAAPISVGQPLYWHLRNELHHAAHCERYALMLEHLLSHHSLLCHELTKQLTMVRQLTRVSELVQRLKREGLHDADIEREYRQELTRLNAEVFSQQEYVLSPLHPKRRATVLVVEKCRYMSSKMVPLWLVFRNADRFTHSRPGASVQTVHPAELMYLMFKCGDDLRQDILTLQLLRFMDQLWLSHHCDLRLKPYQVVATGVSAHSQQCIGLIDVVLNSDTTSGIQLNPQYGGGTTGAFKLDPIDQFLRFHNRGNVQAVDPALGELSLRPAYDVAVENFVHSCAGYCVATYVLGVGDRHNGNIMVTKRGHLFHIDFGHFLGNFKKKFGVNRERAAFVFTPEMAFVMGGSGYAKSPLFRQFLTLSRTAFKLLRSQAVNELEMLMLLMANAGMPELSSEADIGYMREKLYVTADIQEGKAEKKLLKEIDKSLNSNYRRFDNFIHNVKHK